LVRKPLRGARRARLLVALARQSATSAWYRSRTVNDQPPDTDRPGSLSAEERQSARRSAREHRRQRLARRRALALLALVVVIALVVWRIAACGGGSSTGGGSAARSTTSPTAVAAATALPPDKGDGVKMATFLGNATRRFYGLGPAPKHLSLIWSTAIGSGWTSGKTAKEPPSVWSGTGWTGEPALVRDGGKLYILVGGYDHNLHKIDAATGKTIWKYPFDDIIKSSPSVIANPSPTGKDDKYIVMAGSRRGYPMKIDDPRIASYRAVAFGSGKELWRLPVPQTICYSRDCDGSGFYLAGREYIGVESGWFYALDPLATEPWGKYRQPKALAKTLLLGTPQDAKGHGPDLALEASPALLNGIIYITSGAGEVYGLRPSDLKVVYDYHTGSDLNGTSVPTTSGKLLIPVEKQYIPGHGGVLMLDPSKPAAQSLVWYFPTGDRAIGDWLGGIIGSVGVNDDYNPGGHRPALAAFLAIDGYAYVVSQDTLAKKTVSGPNLETGWPTPKLVAKVWVDGGVSTPIFIDDDLIVTSYDDKVHEYHLSYAHSTQGAPGALPAKDGTWWKVSLHETSAFTGGGSYESTPIVWDGRVYVGSRNGYFYCLGDK